VIIDPDFFSYDPAIMQDIVANWNYLWLPLQQPQLDERRRYYVGDDVFD